MCSFFLITHQCSSGALIRPATAGRISPILLLLRCEPVCVCVFQCVSYPCLSLEPFQKWLCHPASQISRRKCSVFLPERSRPLLFLVQASKQVTAAQVVHLLRSACVFTFLDVASLASGLYRLCPCQSPGAASVPSPGIKKQLKRLMHSSKDEQPAVNVLIFNT